MRNAVIALLAIIVFASPAAQAQTLYALDIGANYTNWITLDPDTGATLSVLNTAPRGNEQNIGYSMAMNPSNGVLSCLQESEFTTINLASGNQSIQVTWPTANYIRDITFQSSGQGWGVSGSVNGYRLYLINFLTGTGTQEAFLGKRSSITCIPRDNKVVLLTTAGAASQPDRLEVFDPATPSTRTTVMLTGDPLPGVQYHESFIYDPYNDRFIMAGYGSSWFLIETNGVTTYVGDEAHTSIQGLSFDRNGTTWFPPDVVTLGTDDRLPELRWARSFDAESYQLYIRRNGKTYINQWLNETGSVWTAASGFSGGTYDWWFRSWASADGYGNWYAGPQFTIPTRRPAAVTNLQPAEGIPIYTNRPEWCWDADPNASHYNIYVKLDGAVYVNTWLTTTTYTHAVDLPFGKYDWWIRPWSLDGYGQWSKKAQFTYGTATPYWPTGVVTEFRAPPVVWYHPGPEMTWCQLLVHRNGSKYYSQWTNVDSIVWLPNTALPSGDYKCWVRAWGPSGQAWSDPLTFTIPSKAPEEPILYWPTGPDGGNTLDYIWNCDPNATWYQVFINKDGALFHDQWYQQWREDGRWTNSISGHTAGSTYEWWVRCWGPDGYGPWSTSLIHYQ